MAQGRGSFPGRNPAGVSSSIDSASAQQGERVMMCIRSITRMLPVALAVLALAIPATAAERAAPAKSQLDPAALAGRIDQAIQTQLEAGKIKPGPLTDDAEFLRRVYLDITGVIPTTEQATAFLDNQDPNK